MEIIKLIDCCSEWINFRSIHDDILENSIRLFKYQCRLAFSKDNNVEKELKSAYEAAVNTYVSVPVIRMSSTYACSLYLRGKEKESREIFNNFKAGCKLCRAFYGDELLIISCNNRKLKEELKNYIICRYREDIVAPIRYDFSKMGDGRVNAYDNEKITIGRIIGFLRKQQNLSYAELSEGICTRSWIYKIEKEDSFPKIMQVNAILQRLGIVDQVFDFIGSSDDEQFYKYRNILVRDINILSKTEIAAIIDKMEHLNTSKDKLGMQFILFIRAAFISPKNEMYQGLVDALKLTQPEFENNIISKRLSWNEFNIIQYICRCKYTENSTDGIRQTYSLIKYLKKCGFSIEQYQYYLPMLYNSLSYYLYTQEKYDALDALLSKYENPIMRYYMHVQIYYMYMHLKSMIKRGWHQFDINSEQDYIINALKLILRQDFADDLIEISEKCNN